MAAMNVKILRDLHPPVEEGVHFRLLCMSGENKGLSYYLTGHRVVMGRSDKVDIQVLDVKSSREHAELILNSGRYIVTDLGSQNGIVVNDLKITQHRLNDGDKIIIGATVFKFNRYDIEKKSLALVENKDSDEEENEDQYDDEYDDEEENEGQHLLEEASEKKPRHKKVGESRKRLLTIVVVLLFIFVLFGDEEKVVKVKKVIRKQKTESLSLDEKLRRQGSETREVQRKLDAIIHRGQREFRERNFFRAIRQFELALILSPNNGRASFYLDRSKQRLDEEIEIAFNTAALQAGALKYPSAIVSLCSIVKLLQTHPGDERYKDALKNIRTVEKEMGKLKNEIKCIQK